jgi:hypothetical protein
VRRREIRGGQDGSQMGTSALCRRDDSDVVVGL